MTAARPPVGVGAVLLDAAGRVLIGHRVKADEAPSWCLPGGHLEAAETFEEAAAREALEEAGVVVTEPQTFAIALQTTGSGITAGVIGRVAGAACVCEPAVFREWRWVSPDALPEPLYPASKMLLQVWRGGPAPAGWAVHRTGGRS